MSDVKKMAHADVETANNGVAVSLHVHCPAGTAWADVQGAIAWVALQAANELIERGVTPPPFPVSALEVLSILDNADGTTAAAVVSMKDQRERRRGRTQG